MTGELCLLLKLVGGAGHGNTLLENEISDERVVIVPFTLEFQVTLPIIQLSSVGTWVLAT
jgi:hypothetical protein